MHKIPHISQPHSGDLIKFTWESNSLMGLVIDILHEDFIPGGKIDVLVGDEIVTFTMLADTETSQPAWVILYPGGGTQIDHLEVISHEGRT